MSDHQYDLPRSDADSVDMCKYIMQANIAKIKWNSRALQLVVRKHKHTEKE